MIRKAIQLFVLFTFLSNWSFAQFNFSCINSEPFCSDLVYSFPMQTGTSAESGPNYGCLYSQPNPNWYYLLVDQPGDFEISITTNPLRNVNFILWGPYTSQTAPCTAQLTAGCSICPNNTVDSTFYPSGNLIDCSYDTASSETIHINNTMSGQYYLLMLSNYSNLPCNLIMYQNNYGEIGAGSTNCIIPIGCDFTSMTATPSACDPLSNTFSISGSLTFSILEHTDSIIVIDSVTGNTVLCLPPFNSVAHFFFNQIPADGLNHYITARWSSCNDNGVSNIVQAPFPCSDCFSNAGPDTTVCGLSIQLNAEDGPGDINTHWISQSGVSYSDINSTNTNVQVNTYGNYNCNWEITNSNGITCTDIVSVEFVEDITPEISFINDTLFSSALYGNQWYDANGIIAGADTNFLKPVGNGSYFVAVNNECVQDSSEIFVFTSVNQLMFSGIEPKFIQNGHMLNIESKIPIKEITVYTLLGQPVMRKENPGLNCTLNFESLHSGLYLIKLSTVNGIYTKVIPLN